MAKCWNCKKSGWFMLLSSDGLCMKCLEKATSISVETLEKLWKDKNFREEYFEKAEKLAMEFGLEEISVAYDASPFSVWDISIHAERSQRDRIVRSKSVELQNYNPDTQVGEAVGSKDYIYTVSFSSCTCGDFIARRLPCKHIYKLASQYAGIDLTDDERFR